MGYGFLGAVSGLGKGATRYGTAVMEDAFEERRQERIKKIQEEMEATRHQYALERQDQQNVFTNERDETLHGFQVDRDEAGFANTDKRDAAGRAHDINKLNVGHGHDLALESHKQKIDPAKMPPGTPGAKVDTAVLTSLREDFRLLLDPGDMSLAAASSQGDEAFLEYIESIGKAGDLQQFARDRWKIDIRTGTYLDENTLPQPSQGVGLLGGGGFAGAGDSSGPAAPGASGGPQPGGPGPGGPQPGGSQPPAGQAGLMSQTEAAPAQWDRSGGSSTPTRVPAQEAGPSPVEQAIDSHPDMAARVRARNLLNEAREALAAEPGDQAMVEQALVEGLRELGIRL